MKTIILECKRILSRIILCGFLIFVIVASAYNSHRNTDRYNVRDAQGIAVGWKDNLSDAKTNSIGLYLDKESMEKLRTNENLYGRLNYENIRELISGNYDRKTLEQLSDDEMESFLHIRAEHIYENLVLDTNMDYTDEEIQNFMDSAKSLSDLSMGCAEGWKMLEEGLGNFIFLIAVIISALALPLFGRDSSVQMEELTRSAKFGKQRLDMSRVAAAYLMATALYICSIMIYFFITMLPFGFDGASRPIQSNVRTFFSLYNITYFQQFALNLLIGYVSLIFMVSLSLTATIILKNILAGASVIAAFYVMLIIFNQIYLYPVNHWFANFMPVRMTDFWHFYTGNELYRIGGRSISCMVWSIVVSLTLSVLFLTIGIITLYVNRRKGEH